MTTPSKQPAAEVHIDEIRRLIDEAKARPLTEAECDQLLSVAMSYCQVGEMLADRTATIAKLRKMLFGTSSEKTDAVLGSHRGAASTTTAANTTDAYSEAAASKTAQKGHGRNGADAYRSATRTRVLLESMKAGDKCPECPKGVLYKMAEPAVMVRVFGGPPLHAHVCELERLRCNLCSKIFTAKGPVGLGTEKYDATPAAR
jgi:hypothetical protein